MIYPTRRAVLAAAVSAPLAAVLGVLAPDWWVIAPVFLLVLACLMLADLAMGPSSAEAEISVTTPRAFGVGAPAEVIVTASAGGRHVGRAQMAIETNDRLRASPPGPVTIEPQASATTIAVEPVRRGEAVISRAWARWRGPLGLVWKQASRPLDVRRPVTADVEGLKREAVRLFARDAMFGAKTQIEVGEGAEYHALRDFQPGMDVRTVDWKSSAKHGVLRAKEFRTERNHNVILALDTGRLMSEPLAGLPKVDRALNAALLLAFVSLKIGDRAGLFAFDAKPRLFTGALAGAHAFPLLQRMGAKIDYSTAETNFTLGLTSLAGELERRSLVVVFTDFVDTTSAELMVENVGRLAKRHLVVFVALKDDELEGLARARPEQAEDIARAVTAAAMLRERGVVIMRLRRLGVQVLEAPYRRLGPELLNAYLDIKRRELL